MRPQALKVTGADSGPNERRCVQHYCVAVNEACSVGKSLNATDRDACATNVDSVSNLCETRSLTCTCRRASDFMFGTLRCEATLAISLRVAALRHQLARSESSPSSMAAPSTVRRYASDIMTPFQVCRRIDDGTDCRHRYNLKRPPTSKGRSVVLAYPRGDSGGYFRHRDMHQSWSSLECRRGVRLELE